jgi:hypothetical protein
MAFTGPYPTVFSGHTTAMVISATTFSSGVTNTGTIGPGGISVVSGAFLSGGGILDTGTIAGGIKVDSSSKIVASGGTTKTAIAVKNTPTFGGGISNAGLISAFSDGILAASISVFSGGIRNNGTIVATSHAIVVSNATVFAGGITNSGHIAGGGISGAVWVSGVTRFSGGIVNASVVGNGIVDVLSGGTANVRFLSTGSGGLEIADTNVTSNAFTGRVSGFGGVNHSNHKQFIDLVSVTSAPNTISLSYVSANAANTSGTLFVSSAGAQVAAITMVGHYASGNFHITAGTDGTVAITDPAVPNGGSVEPAVSDITLGAHTTLAYSENSKAPSFGATEGRYAAAAVLLGNYMAGSFVTAADGHGGARITEGQTEQPLLAHPRA